jgi:hypothetical protein
MRIKIFVCLISVLALPTAVASRQATQTNRETGKHTANVPTAVLWREPQDLKTRNLRYGPGGTVGQPMGRFRFIEEDKDGTNPKFVVEDARGVRWKAKLGEEVRSETAATRLLWAIGYFSDESYYLPQIRVAGLPRLRRGQEFVSANGLVRGVRLERVDKGIKKVGKWHWDDNPFVGTKEFDGLRIMMALFNNWDLKNSNNGIYNVRDRELRYVVTDLGATFGKTGGNWSRSKSDVQDYVKSKFIEEVEPTKVDLVMNTRPPLLYAVAVPYFYKRTRMETVTEDIPLAHARWLGGWLARLSTAQISDTFRGAGYSPSEVTAYTRKIRERIRQLNHL